MILYIIIFISACLLALVITRGIITISRRYHILDAPSLPLKAHAKEMPLLGGIGIFLTSVLVFFILLKIGEFVVFQSQFDPLYGLSQNYLARAGFQTSLASSVPLKNLIAIFIASIILGIGGFIDDRFKIKPSQQFIFPMLATIIVIASGVGIRTATNPLYEIGLSAVRFFNLDAVKLKLITIGGIPYFFSLYADSFTFLWLLGMMYTTKFLDGLDGLVAGITEIGFIVLFAVSIILAQPVVGMFSIILAGATLGFLWWNFHPSKIFLGEFGSIWLGFILGTLAIMGEARVSITLLIMAIPILDVCWIILRRLFFEKKSPFQGDRKHLHFRLLDKGFTHRQSVFFLYALSALCGAVGLFLRERGRIITFILLLLLMLLIGFWLTSKKLPPKKQQ